MFRDPSDLVTLDEFLDDEGVRGDVSERASRSVATASETTARARARQIRPKLKVALVAIVETGAKISDAAQSAGLTYEGLRIALRRPHIQAELTRLRHAWLENETGKAFLTVAKLANGAASEDVQLKAAKFLIEQDQATRAASPGQARQLVQIVFNGSAPGFSDVTVNRSTSGGVFEAPAYSPPLRPISTDDGDD